MKPTILDIKKILYKEKPMAKVIDKISTWDIYVYEATCSIAKILFEVPVKEMGESIFKDEEPAQLLIRWIFIWEEENI